MRILFYLLLFLTGCTLFPSENPQSSATSTPYVTRAEESITEQTNYIFYSGKLLGVYDQGNWLSHNSVALVPIESNKNITYEEIFTQDHYYIFDEMQACGEATFLVLHSMGDNAHLPQETFSLPITKVKKSGEIGPQMYTRWLFSVDPTSEIKENVLAPQFVFSQDINPYIFEAPTRVTVSKENMLEIQSIVANHSGHPLNEIQVVDAYEFDVDGDSGLERLFLVQYKTQTGYLLLEKDDIYKLMFDSSYAAGSVEFPCIDPEYSNFGLYNLNGDSLPEIFIDVNVPTGSGFVVFTYADGELRPVLEPYINN